MPQQFQKTTEKPTGHMKIRKRSEDKRIRKEKKTLRRVWLYCASWTLYTDLTVKNLHRIRDSRGGVLGLVGGCVGVYTNPSHWKLAGRPMASPRRLCLLRSPDQKTQISDISENPPCEKASTVNSSDFPDTEP